jgi:hypothetical protein
VHGHTAKFMLCISGLRIGDRVPTSTPACPHGTTFPSLFHAVTRHNVCPQTANSGQHARLDRDYAESEARDGGSDGTPDIARPRRWKTDTSGQASKVLLLQLSERTSARGNRYMRGWLGKATVVAFQGEKDEAGNQSWDVYVSTPEPREGLAGGARQRVYGREGDR